MTETVTGLFDDYTDAENAVRALENAGIDHSDISIVANNDSGRHAVGNAAAGDAGTGAEVGGAIGGVGGLLAGLGVLVLPGFGALAAAGWLGATLLGAIGGAVVGGATGGIVGALTEAGVPEDDANVYAEGVRRGGTLVTARVPDAQASVARSILSDNRNVDIVERRTAYRNEGWTRFDEDAGRQRSPVI